MSDRLSDDSFFNSIETIFCRNNFTVQRTGQFLTFERKTTKDKNLRYQIILELLNSLSQGKIYIDSKLPKMLICRINYFKQLFFSIILGILITFIFSIIKGHFFILLLEIGVPIVVILMIIGILKGNYQIDKIINEAIEN
jgi:pilus assembly protein TadC